MTQPLTAVIAVEWYDIAGLKAFEEVVGIKADAASVSFDDLHIGWNGSRISPFVTHGCVPERTWGGMTVPMAEIVAGIHDAKIAEHARFSKSTTWRFRPWHECNISPRQYPDPELYKAAWRKVHGIFRANGNKVPFIWTPNHTNGGPANGGNPTFEAFYPGDDFVDYVGLDGYSYPKDSNKPFERIFAADFDRLRAISTRPLIVGETGVDAVHPNRAYWLREMFSYLASQPDIVSLTYWNRDQYRIDNDPAAAQAFRDGLNFWRSTMAEIVNLRATFSGDRKVTAYWDGPLTGDVVVKRADNSGLAAGTGQQVRPAADGKYGFTYPIPETATYVDVTVSQGTFTATVRVPTPPQAQRITDLQAEKATLTETVTSLQVNVGVVAGERDSALAALGATTASRDSYSTRVGEFVELAGRPLV